MKKTMLIESVKTRLVKNLNRKSKLIRVLSVILVATFLISFNSSHADFIYYPVENESLELPKEFKAVDISEFRKFSLDCKIILESNLRNEKEIMEIHRKFVEQTVKLGYLNRVNHLIYEKKLEEYHIEVRIGIKDNRFKNAFEMKYTSKDIKDYESINIYSDDDIIINAYIAAEQGCIEGLGGVLHYSVKNETFTVEEFGTVY